MRKFLSKNFGLIINLLLFLLFLTGFALSYVEFNPTGEINFPNLLPEANAALRKLAYVSGEVEDPGIYEIKEDLRIAELIEMAGGFTENADQNFIASKLDLAAKVIDEQTVFIPSKGGGETGEGSVQSQPGKVNINTASISELDTLPGIGPATAEKIIQARPFGSVEEIKRVSGIGEKKYSDIVNLISI